MIGPVWRPAGAEPRTVLWPGPEYTTLPILILTPSRSSTFMFFWKVFYIWMISIQFRTISYILHPFLYSFYNYPWVCRISSEQHPSNKNDDTQQSFEITARNNRELRWWCAATWLNNNGDTQQPWEIHKSSDSNFASLSSFNCKCVPKSSSPSVAMMKTQWKLFQIFFFVRQEIIVHSVFHGDRVLNYEPSIKFARFTIVQLRWVL